MSPADISHRLDGAASHPRGAGRIDLWGALDAVGARGGLSAEGRMLRHDLAWFGEGYVTRPWGTSRTEYGAMGGLRWTW